MIVEFVDTVDVLLHALAAWILAGAAAATACLFALIVVVRMVWRLVVRATVGAWRALGGRPGGVQALDASAEVGAAPEGVSAHVAVPAPSWARTDHHREDQAA